MIFTKAIPISEPVAALPGPSLAESHSPDTTMMASGLANPEMNAERGRRLFAQKGFVVCHSINGGGGANEPMLDTEFMDMPMNPFEFAARTRRGAEAKVELQRDELGDVIEMNGEEINDYKEGD